MNNIMYLSLYDRAFDHAHAYDSPLLLFALSFQGKRKDASKSP